MVNGVTKTFDKRVLVWHLTLKSLFNSSNNCEHAENDFSVLQAEVKYYSENKEGYKDLIFKY